MRKIYLLSLFVLISIITSAQANWIDLGFTPTSGEVKAIAVDPNGNIYVGGTFPGYIKKYNGTTWEDLGTGVNGAVYSIVAKNNVIYFGGNFTSAGGAAAKYVAKWNGSNSTWAAVGNGFNAAVRTLIVVGTTVYAGGNFSSNDSANVTLNHVALLIEGATPNYWRALGSGISNTVYCLALHNNVLFAGTDNFGGCVSQYNGSTSWSSDNSISGGICYALASFQSYLYAGGDFSTPVRAAAKWTSSTSGWQTITTNFPYSTNVIYSYLVKSGYNSTTMTNYTVLFIAGNFTGLGSPVTSYVGLITSSGANSPMKSLTSNSLGAEVYALGTTGSTAKLIAGGKFTSPANRVGITSTTVGIDDINENVISSTLFPNPLTDRSVLRIETKNHLKNPTIEIYDLQSRLVNGIKSEMTNSNNLVEFILEKNGLSKGTYFYVVRDEDQLISSNRFIVN